MAEIVLENFSSLLVCRNDILGDNLAVRRKLGGSLRLWEKSSTSDFFCNFVEK